jgi:hypothetical protein
MSPANPTTLDVVKRTVITDRACYPVNDNDGIASTVSGSSVDILATLTCIDFTPPPNPRFDVSLGRLTSDTYHVQYRAALDGLAPQLFATSSFVVVAETSARIPALGIGTLIGLPLLLIVVASIRLRAKRRPISAPSATAH